MALIESYNGGEPVRYERFKPAKLTATELAAYSGAFFSPELDYTLVVFLDEAKLLAKRRGGDSAISPIENDVFTTAEGFVLRFDRDTAGQVSGLRVDSGRVRNIAFTRQSPRSN